MCSPSACVSHVNSVKKIPVRSDRIGAAGTHRHTHRWVYTQLQRQDAPHSPPTHLLHPIVFVRPNSPSCRRPHRLLPRHGSSACALACPCTRVRIMPQRMRLLRRLWLQYQRLTAASTHVKGKRLLPAVHCRCRICNCPLAHTRLKVLLLPLQCPPRPLASPPTPSIFKN